MQAILAKKRRGLELTSEEVADYIQRLSTGKLHDAQIGESGSRRRDRAIFVGSQVMSFAFCEEVRKPLQVFLPKLLVS